MLKTISVYAAPLLFLVALARAEGPRENLKDLSARYGFPEPRQGYSNITFRSGCSTLTFEMNSRRLLFNNVLIWMNDTLAGNGTGWSIDRYDATRIIDPLLRPDRLLLSTGQVVVVVDPGHGGPDAGASGPMLAEKDLTLDIAMRVHERLRLFGLDARLTRDRDTALTLDERSAAARQQGASLFVSIHMNWARNSGASGMETYIVSAPGFASTAGDNGKNDPQPGNRFDAGSLVLGYEVQRATLAATGATDRGVKHARFEVLAQAPCPAILVECGFLSNPYEENMLSMKAYRDVLADGLASGIMTYVSNTSGTP